MSGPTEADPYLIPGTNVLRNRVGARTMRELEAAENDLVNARYTKLSVTPLRAEGTVAQLRWIHHYLFQDMYEWAGRIRTIDMSKGGGSVFQPLQLFATGVRYAESTLRNDHMPQGSDRGRFIERLTANYDNFNTLHPFREGNGRAQRVFWTLVARDAGWALDWARIGRRENDYASFIAYENVDYDLLEAMFDRIVQPLPPGRDRRLLPSIDFEPGTDEAPGRQKQRYSYQTKGGVNPKGNTSGIRRAPRAETGNPQRHPPGAGDPRHTE